ncbi:protein disulfide-isomerase A4-like, partial [Clarias magur]
SAQSLGQIRQVHVWHDGGVKNSLSRRSRTMQALCYYGTWALWLCLSITCVIITGILGLKSEASNRLKKLWTLGWMGSTTHAVMLQFTLYSPVYNLFTTVTILGEMSCIGGVLSSVFISSIRLYHSVSALDYWTTTGEVIIVLFSLLCVICSVHHFTLLADTMEKLQRDDFKTFVDLSSAASWEQIIAMIFLFALSSLMNLVALPKSVIINGFGIGKFGDLRKNQASWMLCCYGAFICIVSFAAKAMVTGVLCSVVKSAKYKRRKHHLTVSELCTYIWDVALSLVGKGRQKWTVHTNRNNFVLEEFEDLVDELLLKLNVISSSDEDQDNYEHQTSLHSAYDFCSEMGDENRMEEMEIMPSVCGDFLYPDEKTKFRCGHCKQFAPEYEKIAQTLKENDPPIPVAKVDATVASALASKFDVSGYPTIKILKKGEAVDYDGERTEKAIVDRVKEVAQPDWKPPPEATLVLTKDNFDDVVNNADIILVEFYAPWCGHCKRLAPEYEKAAKELGNRMPPIPLAKVDATTETDVASRFDVTGYPTLKIFRKGKVFDYNGPREKFGIVDYMSEQAGPPSKQVQAVKQIQELVKDGDDAVIVGVFSSDEDAAYEVYQEACNTLRDDYKFRHTFTNEVAKFLKASPGQVVMLQPEKFRSKYEPSSQTLTIKDSTTATEIQDFFKKHTLPLVGHRKQSNAEKRYSSRPLVVVYYGVDFSFDYRVATQYWRSKVLEVAKDFPEYTFAIADEEDYADELKSFGLSESGEEVNVGILGESGKKYAMEPEEFDSDVLREFVLAFKK